MLANVVLQSPLRSGDGKEARKGRKKEEGRRKKEEGRRKKEEGRRKKEEGRRKKEEGRRKEGGRHLLKSNNPHLAGGELV